MFSGSINTTPLTTIDDIPMATGKADVNMGDLVPEDYIENSEKTVQVDLSRSVSTKDMVKDHIFKHHMRVFAANSTADSGKKEKKGVKDLSLRDTNGMYYYTSLYMGTDKQKLNVAFSTASTITVINSKNCQGCQSHTGFDFSNSFSIHKVLDKHVKYEIGGESAEGLLVMDDMKFSENSNYTLKQFPFLLVNKWQQSVFEKVDGIMGLSRQYITTNGHNSGSQLLDSLYESGQIEKKTFSIHYEED